MSKNTYFFSHDLNSHQDEKIIDLRMDYGMEGYGVYWLLVELLAGSSEYRMELNPKRIAFAHSVDEKVVSDVISKYGLFEVEGNTFFSKSLMDRMSRLDDIKKRRAEAGRKGGLAKARHSNCLAKPSNCLANSSKGKERKGEEKEIYKEIPPVGGDASGSENSEPEDLDLNLKAKAEPEEKKKKSSAKKEKVLHPLHERLILLFQNNVRSTARDVSELRAWDKAKNIVTEDDVALLEKFYRLPKSENHDKTWNRKTAVKQLMNQIVSQLEIAESHFNSKKTSRPDRREIPEPKNWKAAKSHKLKDAPGPLAKWKRQEPSATWGSLRDSEKLELISIINEKV